ncbi:MAG TPA: 2,3-bisphosphoglycerate-independent phosphoglycerate mutase [Nitrospiraceae bacterium]|nr:2,3-bisphosphoglycerate-independent phosphoglycerate mutase [Nitrospiraceae bacterium]
MKYVILHADGLCGGPRPELDGRTPLQAAVTPHLDRLAQSGELGPIVIPGDDLHPASEVTAMALLGYDPRKYYTGPAPLEAASLGVAVGEHDVVFCCTMVTLGVESPHNAHARDLDVKKLGPQLVMEDATAGAIETEQARELIDVMNEQLGSETIQFYPGSGHRHLMVWVGGKARALCVDPQHVVGRTVGEYLPSGDGADTLRKLMDASIVILRDHPVNEERRSDGLKPANCLWLWGQGRASEWPTIAERYSLNGAFITGSEVHRGVGLCAGLNPVEVTSERGAETSLYEPYRATVERELSRHDLLYVHAGLPDDVLQGHDLKRRVQAIEEYDRDLVGPLLRLLERQPAFRLLVICHSASSAGPSQTSTPVFYVLCESPLRTRAAGKGFNEIDATAGSAPPREATKILPKVLSRGT